MNNKLLSKLNPEQKIVASAFNGPMLVLAGAGTGKTTTIVHRTANILQSQLCNAQNILTLTFTNKAAREMQERGMKILEDNNILTTGAPEFTTFHSWGLKFIKSFDYNVLKEYGVNYKFTILGNSDQISVLNKCFAKILNLEDYKLNKAKDFLLKLSYIQNIMTPYDSIESAYDHMIKYNLQNDQLNELEDYLRNGFVFQDDNFDFLHLMASIFFHYKRIIRLSNSLDFDDLINLPIRILQDNESVRDSIRSFYKYIMVDEFQDTNGSQLELINLILGNHCNICVVGDDSQAIYGWRGARIKYILNFHNYYKNTVKFNLTINYRSDINIVNGANTLLSHANEKHEFKKPLSPHSTNLGLIRTKFFKDAYEESKNISGIINQILSKTDTLNGEIAILYRSAFIAREIETELIKNGIKYKIHNGKTLLERKISLDILSYVKYLANSDNEIALTKILESGSVLSDKRIGQFQIEAENNGETFIEYIKAGEFNIKGIGAKIKNNISSFNEEVSHFSKYDLKDNASYIRFVDDFFNDNLITSSLDEKIKNKKGISEDIYEKALRDKGVLDLIKKLMCKYDNIDSFLSEISIEGEAEDKEDGKVNLMTIHASKGLEFDYVFLPGFCQGIIPSAKNMDTEEERRLAFVAITRARKGLFVSGANKYFGGQNENYSLSRFVEEAGLEEYLT